MILQPPFIRKIMQVLLVLVIAILVFSKLTFHTVTCVSKVLPFSPRSRLKITCCVICFLGIWTMPCMNLFKLQTQHYSCTHVNSI